MNLSGLSYLQFALVDGFVLVYLFLRVHMVRGWAEINPVSVARLSSRSRGSGMVTLVGFYSSVAASALFLAKDAIMAGQELDDVALCRTAVYLQQSVTPLDTQQLDGVKRGLALWDVGSGLQLLALGCVMSMWASGTVRQLLGPTTLLRAATGWALLGLGGLGLVGAVVSHAAAFHSYGDDAGRARSVARLVSSVFFAAFLGLVAWTAGCVTRILRHTVARNPAATAALALATFGAHGAMEVPMATMQFLVGMQMVAFMRDTAVHLSALLLLRVVFFLAFDISYLTPQQLAVSNLAENNVFTGISTLATALVSAVMVQALFPVQQHVVGAVLAKAATELDGPRARLAFIDGQASTMSTAGGDRSVMMAVPKLSASVASRTHSFSNAGEATIRSRAPTTASLAVEKATGASWGSSSHQRLNSQPLEKQQPFGDAVPHQNANYLDQIPYIDRADRENSFFSQGPWTHPVTRTLSPHPLAESASAERTSQIGANANPFVRRQEQQKQHSHLAVPNASLIFSDDGDAQPRTDSAFIPLSSSSMALTQKDMQVDHSGGGSNDLSASIASNMTRPSNGQSLHAEALVDRQASPPAVPGDDRPDSIVSSYIRPDNSELPTIRRLFVDAARPPSFVSADYQYEPGDPRSPANPFEDASDHARLGAAPVFVADAALSPDEARPSLDLATPGPILIRKGSKASVRRKGTVERRRRSLDKTRGKPTTSPDSSTERMAASTNASASASANASATSSTETNANGLDTAASAAASAPEKKTLRTARMSAFSGAPIKLAALLGNKPGGSRDRSADPLGLRNPAAATSPLAVEDPMKRDSSTISGVDWDQTHGKHASGASFHQQQQQHQYQPSRDSIPVDGASLPASLFKNSVSSIGSRTSNDVFASFASIHTTGGDAFFTPDASLAQIDNSSPQQHQNQTQNQMQIQHQLEASDADILAIPAASSVEDRPSTAPTSASAGYRHTLEATTRRTSPSAQEMFDGSGDAIAVRGAPLSSASSSPEGAASGSIRVRRAQTLRKAVDTDALAIEHSLHTSENDRSANALISALPMPEPPSLNDGYSSGGSERVIL
ncbi:hypothetical protein EV177_000967 [Coemansia sp. RSA 1804]|nr:hypothetical protein EV177_000967 [Coemansia sp. RSA 1804]